MIKKSAQIIVGLGYGEEGKGLITDYFSRKHKDAIVVRYNGGQQAGHTVYEKNGNRHVFSNFGAGTFRGLPTYWSHYCTFCPAYFLSEYNTIKKKPLLFLDKRSPVTTHYDVLFNRCIEASRGKGRHGSCGMGFGATVDRHKQCAIKFVAKDLVNDDACTRKLSSIKRYYHNKFQHETGYDFTKFDHDLEDSAFMKDVQDIKKLITRGRVVLTTEKVILNKNGKWNNYLFEGAQGVLLDVEFGEQPYITKSNTTSKNAIDLISRNFNYNNIDVTINYVTRVYQTRHGEGSFKVSKPQLFLKNLSSETNVYNVHQGVFKKDHLNLDLLNYSIECDDRFSNRYNKNLFITCIDHLLSEYPYVYFNSMKKKIHYTQIPKLLKASFQEVKYSYHKCADHLK